MYLKRKSVKYNEWMKEKLLKGLKNMKNKHVRGSKWGSHLEHPWKCLLNYLTTFMNVEIYPKKLVSPLMPILKKASSWKYHCCMSNLINNLTKIFLKDIHSGIWNKSKRKVSETQFGIRKVLRFREAIFTPQLLIQRCRVTLHTIASLICTRHSIEYAATYFSAYSKQPL